MHLTKLLGSSAILLLIHPLFAAQPLAIVLSAADWQPAAGDGGTAHGCVV